MILTEGNLNKTLCTGQETQAKPETKMLSAVTSATYTVLNESVYFTCYARDTDAQQSGRFRWVYEDATDFGRINIRLISCSMKQV